MNKYFKLLALACITLMTTVAHAQNKTISIQSTLKNISGEAVPDGDQSITFKLYDSESAISDVWNETATVEVTSGIYSHELGSVSALDPQDFSEQLYLGVSVGTGKELSPRTKLGYAPYAMAVNSIAGGGNAAYFSGGNLSVSSGINANGQIYTIGNITNNGELRVAGKAIVDAISTGFTPIYSLNIGDADSGVDFRSNDWIDIYTGGGSTPNSSFKRDMNGQYSIFSGRGVFGSWVTPNQSITLGIGDANTGFAGTSDTLEFITAGNERMRIMPNGRVGIGTTDPLCVLHVKGDHESATAISTTSTHPNSSYLHYTSSQVNQNTAVPNIVAYFEGSVLASQRIVSAGPNLTFSDERIKKNLTQSNSREDLDILNTIKINEYSHIDQTQDRRTQKKVIAQQVQEVLPNAVTSMRKSIPNVYTLADKVIIDNGIMTITSPKQHGFIKGDKIDLKTDKKDIDEVEVLSVINEHTFTVETDVITENVFVYGKYVDDFLTVDYDAISMLNVSATQELYKRILALEAENKSLKVDNTSLKEKQDRLDSRMAKLEKIMSASSEKIGLTMAND